MSPVWRAVFTVLTALTVLACLGFGIFGIVIGQPILVVACAGLAAIFGYFSYVDVQYWIQYFSQKK